MGDSSQLKIGEGNKKIKKLKTKNKKNKKPPQTFVKTSMKCSSDQWSGGGG